MTYELTELHFKSILRTRNKKNKEEMKMHPHKYVIKFIDEQYGILGGCSNIVIKG